MKKYIKSSYSINQLEDEVNYYTSMYGYSHLSSRLLTEIWNEVFDKYGDENLADDVVDALEDFNSEVY